MAMFAKIDPARPIAHGSAVTSAPLANQFGAGVVQKDDMAQKEDDLGRVGTILDARYTYSSNTTTRGNLVDWSGTVAAGGTPQTVMPANPARGYFFFLNLSSADLWVNFGANAAAATPSIKIPAGAAYEMTDDVSTQSVSVFGGTTGQAYTAKEM